MVARRTYLSNLPSDRRIGLYVYERCDEKGVVTRPKLSLLRQLLTRLGCDTSGWHTFARWQHRDKRKEFQLRQGRYQQMLSTMHDAQEARRLRRRLLLGNIILPAGGLDHQAFRATLCHALGHNVELVRNWTERGSHKNLKQKKLINVPATSSLEPPRGPQETGPTRDDGIPNTLPELLDVQYFVKNTFIDTTVAEKRPLRGSSAPPVARFTQVFQGSATPPETPMQPMQPLRSQSMPEAHESPLELTAKLLLDATAARSDEKLAEDQSRPKIMCVEEILITAGGRIARHSAVVEEILASAVGVPQEDRSTAAGSESGSTGSSDLDAAEQPRHLISTSTAA